MGNKKSTPLNLSGPLIGSDKKPVLKIKVAIVGGYVEEDAPNMAKLLAGMCDSYSDTEANSRHLITLAESLHEEDGPFECDKADLDLLLKVVLAMGGNHLVKDRIGEIIKAALSDLSSP